MRVEDSVEILQGEIGISGLRPAAMLADGQAVDAPYAMRLEMSEPEPGFRVAQAVVVNTGAAPLALTGIRWRFDPARHDGPALRFPAALRPRVFATENLRGDFFFNGSTEGDCYAQELTHQHVEYGLSEDHVFPGLFVASEALSRGLFIAQATQCEWNAAYLFRGRHEDGRKWLFEIEERCGGISRVVLAPGEARRGEQLFFQIVETADPQHATAAYYRVLHANGAFARRALNPLPAQRIYCTWNYDFHADITEARVLEQIPILKSHFPAVKFLQVDDGYQVRDAMGRRAMIDLCYGDPENPFDRGRFPAGPKALAERIKAEGLRPALWLGLWASIGCRMLVEHPDWILRDDTGEPMLFTQFYGGTAILDPSVPGVRDYLDRLCQTVFGDWGFEGVKLDFSTIAFNSKRARYRYADKSAIELRNEIETIFRRHLPADGFFGWCVVCGTAQPFLAQADYFRNAIDIGRGGWQNVRRIALWTANTRMFLQEAPCLPNIDSIGWSGNFTEVEWETWLNFCAVAGGALEVSGDLRKLAEARLERLSRTLELSDPSRTVRCPGLGECWRRPPFVWVAQGDGSSLLGVFNWEDEARDIAIDSAAPEAVGMPVEDAWDGSESTLPAHVALAPHASRLWLFRKNAGRMGRVMTCACLLGCAGLQADPAAALSPAGAAERAETVEGRRNAVRYEDFGAKGDGVADDFDAIIAAHAHANEHDLPVRAEDGATYLIGGGRRTAEIKTDTDFGNATFRIDDTRVSLDDRKLPVFCVRSADASFRPEGVVSLKRGQSNLGVRLPSRCLVVVTDVGARQFIRRGLNQNQGVPKTDVLLVAEDGSIDPRTPLIWDFDAISDLTAHPVDATALTIRGGRFVTIANQAPSAYTYFWRGFQVERSNVRVESLEHRVIGEGEHGAPYIGFIRISRCADVEVRNVVLSGRMTYSTIGSGGKPVSMGSYDLGIERSVNVSVVGCTQANDIDDPRLWGIMSSDFCKNLLYEDCALSRFDAHQGLFNGVVRRSRLRTISLVGGGTFLLEDSVVTGGRLIGLRNDYGSSWQGDVVVRNTVFDPAGNQPVLALPLITGSNDGRHDFGYPCSMPHRVLLENVQIKDLPAGESYRGPVLFGDFGIDPTGGAFPYAPVREIVLRNVTTSSGLPLRIGDPAGAFADARVVRERMSRHLDISGVANRGFTDDATGRGGWLNLGSDALQGMKPGTLSVKGVDFAIIDPAANGNRSVLVLSQSTKLALEPLEQAVVPVGAMADRLYLLHANARVESVGFGAAVEWRYDDGTAEEAPVELGFHMGGRWYQQAVSADRAVPVTVPNDGNPMNPVIGLYATSFPNPHPDKPVASIVLHAPRLNYWAVFALCISQGEDDLLGFDRPPPPARIVIDPGKTVGTIRRLHGNNLAPSTRVSSFPHYDRTADMAALEIPLIRLHDAPIQTSLPVVDVPCVFPLFHQDVDDPRNYVFAPTDDYIAGALKTGGRILYRLGVSIEHSVNHYNTKPPTDPDRWAEICCRIIAHYNEGWADGFHHGIEYWEIWNEANIGPKMWTGTWDEHVDFYVTVSKKIKARFPNIKIGGPALAGATPSLIAKLLEACRRHDAPLDFFSWHIYGNHPYYVYSTPHAIRKLLDQYGFTHTELHLNEWHYVPEFDGYASREAIQARDDAMNGMDSAAFTTAVLSGFQDTPITMANFYTLIDFSSFYRLFDPVTRAPGKLYYALLAFNRLTKYESRLAAAAPGCDNIWVLAGAKPDGSCAALVSCFRDVRDGRDLEIAFAGKTPRREQCRVSVLDDEHDLEETDAFRVEGSTIYLRNPSFSAVYLVEYQPQK